MSHRIRATMRLGVLLTLAASSFSAETPTANSIGMQFVRIEPGDFMMGCSAGDNECNADEKPQHRVQITKSIEMGKYEVTQAEWKAVMNSNPSSMKGDNRPVETVNRTEAEDFLSRLNAKNDGYRYRLPTEAEWEYAARAGATGPYAGNLNEIAWYADNSEDETHPVGMKKPNAWGLYDMEGNVREWVSDSYNRNYYSSSPAVDPTGPVPAAQNGRGGPQRGGATPRGGRGGNALQQQGRGGRGGRGGGGGNLPVMRGGGWDNLGSFLRLSSRYNYYGPTLRVSDVGFRVVRERVSQ